MTADEVEVRRIIADQVAGWNQGDARAWSANCEPDVGFTNILGRRWDTQAGFETRHAEMFRGVFADSGLTVDIERLQFPEPNLAIAELLTTLTGFRTLPPGIRVTAADRLMTRMLEVLTSATAAGGSPHATTPLWCLEETSAGHLRLRPGPSRHDAGHLPRGQCPHRRRRLHLRAARDGDQTGVSRLPIQVPSPPG